MPGGRTLHDMRDLNAMPLAELFAELNPTATLQRLLSAALDEDLGRAGDVTSESIIDPDRTATAAIVPRADGVVCGLAVGGQLCAQLQERYPQSGIVYLQVKAADGDRCIAGQSIAVLTGRLRAIHAVERIALNLMGRMSGIATLTAQFVSAIDGTNALICDTRKTMPGMRGMDKYAVRCGGGFLHRVGLFDAALYKDNHLTGVTLDELCNVLTKAAQRARSGHALRFVEVEVDSLQQLQQALAIEPGLIDIVLLDNFAVADLKTAVAMRNLHNRELQLEASGGVNLHTVRAIAETGVDRISVGALTHSGPHLDLGLDMR